MSTNVNNKVSILEKINNSSPAQIVALPEVGDKFSHLYGVMNGKDNQISRAAYETEKFHFMKLLQDKPELQKCSKLSLYGCFLDMAVQGLSFDPAMKHAYVVSFPTNIGTKDNPKWESRATLLVDGRGELVVRMRQGQIKYADNPVVVWSCDYFKTGLRDGKKFVDHEAVHPRPKDAEIISCYMIITRADGSQDFSVMDVEDVMNLRAFSKQPNSLAWTKGLKGMVETKTIKHAFKSYPKVKLGNFSKLETASIEPEETEFKIDYGFEETSSLPVAKEIPNDEVFAGAKQPETPTLQFEDDEF